MFSPQMGVLTLSKVVPLGLVGREDLALGMVANISDIGIASYIKDLRSELGHGDRVGGLARQLLDPGVMNLCIKRFREVAMPRRYCRISLAPAATVARSKFNLHTRSISNIGKFRIFC